MMHFARATAPASVSKPAGVLSYAFGLWSAALALAQMVSFEEFVEALRTYHVAGERGSIAIAIALISIEIFSVPFLLRLSLSPLARLLSALCVALLPWAWTVMGVAGLLNGSTVGNAGYFGGFLAVPVGVLVLTLDVVWITAVCLSFGTIGGYRALRSIRWQ